MLKSLVIGAVAVSALALAGPAHAAVDISFSAFSGGPDFNVLFPGTNVSIGAADNAVSVFGGGDDNGGTTGDVDAAITDLNGGLSDGTVGWNPYGQGALSQWLSIGGAGGTSFDGNGYASAELDIAGGATSLSFVWGSPSWTNTVTLYNGNTVVGSAMADGAGDIYAYDASNVSTSSIVDASLANTDGPGDLVTITSDLAFTKAVLTTNDGAGGFEVSDISAVPLPPGLPMFASALLGLGLLGFRKRKSVV
jgi:hypothetical protein